MRAEEREDGAVLALLTHRKTGKKLLAASTHLFWNPAFPDIKLAQAALLCKMVRNSHHNISVMEATPVSLSRAMNFRPLCTCKEIAIYKYTMHAVL